MNTLPISVYFIITEDIRDEPNNKKTLLGFFGGDVIDIHRPADITQNAQIVMPSLVIMAILKGQFQNAQAAMRLQSPTGKEILNSHSADISSSSNNSTVVAVRLAPFHLDGYGPYTYELRINEILYPYTFQVREVLV